MPHPRVCAKACRDWAGPILGGADWESHSLTLSHSANHQYSIRGDSDNCISRLQKPYTYFLPCHLPVVLSPSVGKSMKKFALTDADFLAQQTEIANSWSTHNHGYSELAMACFESLTLIESIFFNCNCLTCHWGDGNNRPTVMTAQIHMPEL